MEKHLDLKNELLLVLSELSGKMKIKSTSYFCKWGGEGKIVHAQSLVGEILTGSEGVEGPVQWLPRSLRESPARGPVQSSLTPSPPSGAVMAQSSAAATSNSIFVQAGQPQRRPRVSFPFFLK